MKLRLFIALPLSPDLESHLGQVIRDLKPHTGKDRSVKWVAPENIHLTVRFLGDTDQSLVPQIEEAIDRVAAAHQPISSTIDRLGGFPNLRRPRVIWAGSQEPPEGTGAVASDIDREWQALGFEAERRAFNPHLTLGRVRQGQRVDDLARFIESYRLESRLLVLDRLVLFKSTLTPSGAMYERLHERSLAEARFEG